MQNKYLLFSLTVLFFLSSPTLSYAYLDPGTGSYVLQIFLGIFLAGLFYVKTAWHKIKSKFRKLFNKRQDNSE
jgi:hypothetical protein